MVGVMLNTTSGAEKEKILKTIDELTPGGSTPGESGIRLAYSVAKNHFIEGGNNRIILATDGDFNVGLKTEAELDELISRHRGSGIYLTCLGVGMGNYKDSKIQTLARKGNGNFAYLDNFLEAEKVLLKEFTKTLYSVADDVYMNVNFNPDYVKEYRLIGFDNKLGALSDSLSTVEGGEIGSGHSMQAVFEIIPVDKKTDDNRSEGFAQIHLTYNEPGDTIVSKRVYKSNYDLIPFDKIDKCYQFYSSVIMFGSLLKGSPFIKTTGWNDILALASKSIKEDDRLQMEFIEVVQKAKNLYTKQKKRKGKNSQPKKTSL
jgi:Ca-activated chloride channel family protein